MVKRKGTKDWEGEPEEKKFDKPSQKEHLFQVVDIYDMDNNPHGLNLDPDTVSVKCEVVGGEEEGRTLLQRINIDESWKGFYFTRLFLKAIGEPYKGKELEIDTDRWNGRQFYATVVHNGDYANIDEYNFDKMVDQYIPPVGENQTQVKNPEDIQWDN